MKQFALMGMLGLGVLLTGCSNKVEYVEEDSNRGLAQINDVDIQDFGKAAEKMVQSLLADEHLKVVDGKRKIMAISRISNNTEAHFDTDLLTKRIRVALTKSGKVYTTTAVGLGNPEDPLNKGVREPLRNDAEFNQSTVQKKGTLGAPDLSMSGKILQRNARKGSLKQVSYEFHLSLTDLKTGFAIWEDLVTITKQGKKTNFAW